MRLLPLVSLFSLERKTFYWRWRWKMQIKRPKPNQTELTSVFDSFQVEIQVETKRYETKYLLPLINMFSSLLRFHGRFHHQHTLYPWNSAAFRENGSTLRKVVNLNWELEWSERARKRIKTENLCLDFQVIFVESTLFFIFANVKNITEPIAAIKSFSSQHSKLF